MLPACFWCPLIPPHALLQCENLSIFQDLGLGFFFLLAARWVPWLASPWAPCSGCPSWSRGWARGTQRALPASAALCFCFMLTNSCCNVRPNYYLLLCSSLLRCVCAPGMTPDSCVAHAEMAGQLQLVPLGIFQQLVGCHCAVHSAPCLTFFPY